MGYAFIIFGVLLASALIMAIVVTYGVAKDSQKAPLKALNDYANIKTNQAQTGLTIGNTCLNGTAEYNNPSNNGNPNPGYHYLYLNVSNNGSTVLNSTKATVLYNASYINFTVTSLGNVWVPLKNTSYIVSNLYLDPGNPGNGIPGNSYPGPELRLLVAAENGVSAIAPTTPFNFTVNLVGTNYSFTWNASKDNIGIAYYLIYEFNGAPTACPINPSYTLWVAGNQTRALIACTTCSTTYFFMTAVDSGGNMAIHSRTWICIGSSQKCYD